MEKRLQSVQVQEYNLMSYQSAQPKCFDCKGSFLWGVITSLINPATTAGSKSDLRWNICNDPFLNRG